jgi:carboxyl-terminal processing protease
MYDSQEDQRPGRPARGPAVRYGARTLMMSILLIVAMGVGAGLDRVLIETGIVGAATQLTNSEDFTILEETYDAIRNNYVLEEDISDQELIYGAARGMVEALGDEGHSRFLDPQEAQQFEDSGRGELVGIGIQIDSTGDLPVVIAPIPDSPAYKAGIRPGDTILAVDGVQLDGLDPEKTGDLVRGDEGTQVTLELRHRGETDSYTVTITREKIKVNPVTWAMLPGNVMWLQLSEFSAGATEELKNAIRQAKDLGATGIILDLRNNPGGYVHEAKGIASQFLPDGTMLMKTVDADGKETIEKTVGNNGVWLDGPLVVLVNHYSASSSELVASSIKAAGRAPLIGEKTIGTGTVLLPYELSDGSMAVLGIELWLTASGEPIYKEGIEPNIPIDLPEGISLSLPIEFVSGTDDRVIPDDEFQGIGDTQLHTAYDEVVQAAGAGQ